MKKVFNDLTDADVGKIVWNEPLSKHTTLKIGGPATLFIEPKDLESLQKVVALLQLHGISWRAIGRGSNLLVDDEGVEGAIIKIDKGLRKMEIVGDELFVGAGYPMVPLATVMSRKGYEGFGFAAGIPGSIGGAVYMNAGAHGSDTSKILRRAQILFADGSLKWLTTEELAFSYRTSLLQKEKGIVVEAVFALKKGDADQIWEEMQTHKDYRHQTQPYDKPCCGSVFRNPLPNHAGQLIEGAGLKGHKLGGAQVSELHANFIINAGGAKARDVLDLIDMIKTTIRERHDIELHTEVERVPNRS